MARITAFVKPETVTSDVRRREATLPTLLMAHSRATPVAVAAVCPPRSGHMARREKLRLGDVIFRPRIHPT